jgi:hypothetical protein
MIVACVLSFSVNSPANRGSNSISRFLNRVRVFSISSMTFGSFTAHATASTNRLACLASHRELNLTCKNLEDNEAGKLDKAEEIVGVVLPTNEDPALPLDPGEEALDEPASHVAA